MVISGTSNVAILRTVRTPAATSDRSTTYMAQTRKVLVTDARVAGSMQELMGTRDPGSDPSMWASNTGRDPPCPWGGAPNLHRGDRCPTAARPGW